MKKITTILVSMLLYGSIYSQSWSPLPNVVYSGRYDDIFFINEQIGWAANGSGATVYKTTDSGLTWNEQFSAPESYFRNIEFLDENIGFLGTLEDRFYKTTDGGENWELVSISPYPAAICGLDAVGSSTVYGCGAYFSPACIIKSVDSGETWEYIDMSAHATGLVEILFIDEQVGYVSGNNSSGGVILKTTDGGSSWTEIYNSQVAGDYVWKLQLLENNTHIYGSIQSNIMGQLVKSTDEGQTWEVKPFVDNWVQAVGFISPLHGWMGGHNSGFYETTDGGDTWDSLGIGSYLNRIFIIHPGLAYASGKSLYRFGHGFLATSAPEIPKDDIPVVIAPNPLSDQLNITIDFQHTDNLVAELYDNSGKFIKCLVIDKVESAQLRNYSFDFPYEPGSYSVNIHTNNGRRSFAIVKQ